VAKYNEILIGRTNRYLQKLFQMKGEAPAPQLSAEISPTLSINQPPVEELYLLGINRNGFNTNVAANAANTSQVRLRNPSAANVIAVVEHVAVFTPAIADNPVIAIFGSIATDLATLIPGSAIINLDNRFSTSSRSALIATQTSAAATTAGSIVLYAGPTGPTQQWIYTQEIPIAPGGAVEIHTAGINIAINVCVLWRERFLEEGERT